MNEYIARLTAWAQVAYFMVSLCGFIGVMVIVVTGYAKLDSTSEKLAYTLLGIFGTIVTQQSGYFFQRHRPTAPGEPAKVN